MTDFSVRDLDGTGLSLSHPGNGLAVALVQVANRDLSTVEATVGAEAANVIEVACQLKDKAGDNVAEVRNVRIRSLAVTDGQGDLAAAASAVGTLRKAHNPATGENVLSMRTTADGAFSFGVTNTAAETTQVEIIADGCEPKVIELTFA